MLQSPVVSSARAGRRGVREPEQTAGGGVGQQWKPAGRAAQVLIELDGVLGSWGCRQIKAQGSSRQPGNVCQKERSRRRTARAGAGCDGRRGEGFRPREKSRGRDGVRIYQEQFPKDE